jgi:hypothetical protein
MSKEFKIREPSRAEVLFEFANEPTFPIAILEFEEYEEGDPTKFKIKVDKELFNEIKKQYGTNEIILYCNMRKESGLKFGAFSPEMENSYSILRNLDLTKPKGEWVKEAHKYIEKELEGEE